MRSSHRGPVELCVAFKSQAGLDRFLSPSPSSFFIPLRWSEQASTASPPNPLLSSSLAPSCFSLSPSAGHTEGFFPPPTSESTTASLLPPERKLSDDCLARPPFGSPSLRLEVVRANCFGNSSTSSTASTPPPYPPFVAVCPPLSSSSREVRRASIGDRDLQPSGGHNSREGPPFVARGHLLGSRSILHPTSFLEVVRIIQRSNCPCTGKRATTHTCPRVPPTNDVSNSRGPSA